MEPTCPISPCTWRTWARTITSRNSLSVWSRRNVACSAIEFAEQATFLLDQTESEFLLVIVRAHVRHVQGEIGQVGSIGGPERFSLHGGHIAHQFTAFGQNQFTEMLQIA